MRQDDAICQFDATRFLDENVFMTPIRHRTLYLPVGKGMRSRSWFVAGNPRNRERAEPHNEFNFAFCVGASRIAPQLQNDRRKRQFGKRLWILVEALHSIQRRVYETAYDKGSIFRSGCSLNPR